MAPPVLQKEYFQMVPEFHGDPEQLPRFLELGQKLATKFYNEEDPDDFQNEYLIGSLLSKVKGVAQNQISNRIIKNWTDLKNALLETYSDKRDIFTHTIEMSFMKQFPNESPFDFYHRINNNLNLQLTYIANHVMKTHHECMTQFVNKLALRVLLRGLREPLGPLLRTRDPDSLNAALNMMTNDFQLETSFNKNHNRTSGKSNTGKFSGGQSSSWGKTPQLTQKFGQYQGNNGFQSHSPSPTYVPPQLRNNNFQNPQQNTAFRGQAGTSTQTRLPAPTPMSISTRNTMKTNNFHNIEDSQELSNEEPMEEHYNDQDETYEPNEDGNFPIPASDTTEYN